MFCTNCGKEIVENASFCSNCGKPITAKAENTPPQQMAAVEVKETVEAVTAKQKPIEVASPVVNAAQTAEQHTAATPKAKKVDKKLTIIITLAAVVIFALIGKFVIAPSYMSGDGEDYDTDYNTDYDDDYDTDYATDEDYDYLFDSSYESIFSSRNIIDSSPLFLGLDTAEFAIAKSDGTVEKMAYGYEDDIIKAWEYTMYLTEDTIDEDFYNELKRLSFCTASKKQLSDYCVVTLKFKNLDNLQNINKLAELEFLEWSGDGYMSYSQIANQLISNGYAEK